MHILYELYRVISGYVSMVIESQQNHEGILATCYNRPRILMIDIYTKFHPKLVYEHREII